MRVLPLKKASGYLRPQGIIVRKLFMALADVAQLSVAGPLIKYFKSNNCVVIHKCTTIRHAQVRIRPSSLTTILISERSPLLVSV